jgi:hypothetical protein
VNSDAELYNQIDGGAPKYIDRGWQGSSYANYRKGDRLVQVAVHDMAAADHAEALFVFDLPVSRATVDGAANTAIDMGLPTGYRSQAYVGKFYIEIAIDDRSDDALAAVQEFTKTTIARALP